MVNWMKWTKLEDPAKKAYMLQFAQSLYANKHAYFKELKPSLVTHLGFPNEDKQGNDDTPDEWYHGECKGPKMAFNVYISTCGTVVGMTYKQLGLKPCTLPRGGALYSQNGNFEKLKMSSFWSKMKNDSRKAPFEGIPAATASAVLTPKASGFLCSIRAFKDAQADDVCIAIKSKNCLVSVV